MQWGNSKFGYGALPQALHWLTAICVVVGWLLGQFIDAFPKGPPRAWALWTHITLGECVVLFLIARLVWRMADPPPPLEPTRFGRALKVAAKLGHYTLYALLLAVPCVGIVAQLKRGNPLPVFAAFSFASPWPADRAAAHSILEVHELLANTLLILAGAHAAAALIHHYVWRDRTLVRMLPGAAAPATASISAIADKLR
jgi:cytochrome b561